MATRSTVKFYGEFSETPLVAVYHQFDGYIEGVGHDLANWLKTKTMIIGIGNHKMKDGYANGMGCLAAQYVAEHKTRVGGLYITHVDDEEEYNYHVYYQDNEFVIKVEGFQGSPHDLLNHTTV